MAISHHISSEVVFAFSLILTILLLVLFGAVLKEIIRSKRALYWQQCIFSVIAWCALGVTALSVMIMLIGVSFHSIILLAIGLMPIVPGFVVAVIASSYQAILKEVIKEVAAKGEQGT